MNMLPKSIIEHNLQLSFRNITLSTMLRIDSKGAQVLEAVLVIQAKDAGASDRV